MISWLIVLGIGSAGAYLGRNTLPIKTLTKAIKNRFINSNLGRGYLLSNAKDALIHELIKQEEQLKEDYFSLKLEKSNLTKEKEKLEFLEFIKNNKDDIDMNEVESKILLKKEEIEITEKAIQEKEKILEKRKQKIEEYKKTEFQKKLHDAEIAEKTFISQRCVKKYSDSLEKVEDLGEKSWTSETIERVLLSDDIGVGNELNREFEEWKNNKCSTS